MSNIKSYKKSIISFVIIPFALFFLTIIQTFACEIDFKVLEGEKAKYVNGDEIIVKTTVVYTHRNCPEGIDATKFNTDGLEIVKATKWTEKSPGTFERKLKLKIIGSKKGEVNISAVRTCDKEGGFGSLSLKAVPIK